MKHPLPSLRPLAVVLATAALLLAGCGGGGGSGDTPPPQGSYPPSATLANMCMLDEQKAFVRSYMDEAYLWYDEVPAVDASAYASIPEYFNALRVRTPDVLGLPKDRFSAVLTIPSADAALSSAFGRPRADTDGTATAAGADSVPLTRVVTTPAGRRAGYILFLDHDTGSQDALISAFQQVRDEGVQDLVLDLRYNSGGYLYVALTAASMVTGPQSEGLVFEQLRYNNKRAAETAASFLLFSNRVQFGEAVYPRGTQLPQLGLQRVYVLSTGLTCSASESIINSLRGIDVQVVLIGQSTCGKPYGFRRKDNCGYAYFPIEFQGFNAKGFGDYMAGFAPTCNVVGDTTSPLGNADEPLLSAALRHMDTGTCPPATAQSSSRAMSQAPATADVPVRPAWAGRMMPGR